MFVGVSIETCWGVSLALGQVDGLGIGGNDECCLAIVAIFMGLGGAKR